MATVSLMFSYDPHNWTSRLIGLFGVAKWSHVDTIMPDGQLLGSRSDIKGGKPAGVQARPNIYLGSEEKLQVDLVMSNSQANAYYHFLWQQVGKPYDKIAILGFIVGRNWREDNAWFCDELVASGLEQCGFLRKLVLPTNKLSPGSLLLVLSAITSIPA